MIDTKQIKRLLLEGVAHIKKEGDKYCVCSVDDKGECLNVELSKIDSFSVLILKKEFEATKKVAEFNCSDEGVTQFKTEQGTLKDKAAKALSLIEE